MDVPKFIAAAAVIGSLDGAITYNASSLLVAGDVSGWPSSDFHVKIEDEIVHVGARSGQTLSTLTRGALDTDDNHHPNRADVVYVKTADDFAANGNDGSSSLLRAQVTLEHADILALPTTPFVVIPATSVVNYDANVIPSEIFLPVAATAITHLETGYGVVGDNPRLLLAYSSDWANDVSNKVLVSLSSVGWFQTDIPCPRTVGSDDVGLPIYGMGSQPINGDWLDNALVLALHGVSDLSLGDVANTITVTVIYAVIETT